MGGAAIEPLAVISIRRAAIGGENKMMATPVTSTALIPELYGVPEMTVTEAFEKFLRLSVADGDASKNTLRIYRDGLTRFLGWCRQAAVEPKTASYEDILEYRLHLREAGLKRGTVNLRMVAVRALYTALVRWGVRPDNPAAGVRAPKDPESAASKIISKALSPAEAARLLKVLPTSSAPQDVRDATMVRLMLYHGLRVGEVVALNSDSVDYQSWTTLRVVGKGNKPRTLVLSAEARRDLMAWCSTAKHPQTLRPLLIVDTRGPVFKWEAADIRPGSVVEFHPDSKPQLVPGPAAPLFFRLTGPGYVRMSVRETQKIVKKYLKAAGVDQRGKGCHSLRHSYGMLAVLGGASREALSESMGHQDGRTTDVYTRAAAQFQSNPADAVQKFMREGI